MVKGLDDPDKKRYSRSPGIFINQKTGTIYASVSKEGNSLGDTARTLGYIRPGRWNQIAVVFKTNAIKIYLNGVLDGFAVIKDDNPVSRNKDSLFLGGHPTKPKKCRLEVTVDSLKLYERELKPYEIQAGIRTAFGIIEPSYFHLSCFDCSLQDAKSKCVKGYKLCTSEDMYSGVWQAAHLMGWVRTVLKQTDLGYYIFVDGTEKSDVKGMGVCCRVLN